MLLVLGNWTNTKCVGMTCRVELSSRVFHSMPIPIGRPSDMELCIQGTSSMVGQDDFELLVYYLDGGITFLLWYLDDFVLKIRDIPDVDCEKQHLQLIWMDTTITSQKEHYGVNWCFAVCTYRTNTGAQLCIEANQDSSS